MKCTCGYWICVCIFVYIRAHIWVYVTRVLLHYFFVGTKTGHSVVSFKELFMLMCYHNFRKCVNYPRWTHKRKHYKTDTIVDSRYSTILLLMRVINCTKYLTHVLPPLKAHLSSPYLSISANKLSFHLFHENQETNLFPTMDKGRKILFTLGISRQIFTILCATFLGRRWLLWINKLFFFFKTV